MNQIIFFFTLFVSDLCNYTPTQGLVNKPMKTDDFHKIEKELHEQMLNQQKWQQEIQPKIDSWNVCFDNDISPMQHAGSESSYRSTTEQETFYSLTEDHEVLSLNEASVKVNGFRNGQGLVQRVSEAGILPLEADAKNGKSGRKMGEETS